MQKAKTTMVVLAASLALWGCTKRRYYWDSVPYCQVQAGAPSSTFKQSMRVVHADAGGAGISPLSGMGPTRDVAFDDEVTVAVVACASTVSSSDNDLDAVRKSLLSGTVPEVCPGQRTILGPTEIRATASNREGYDGALPFPKLDPAELECNAGSVAYGEGVSQ